MLLTRIALKCLKSRVDDVNKLGLERSTTDEETVDIRLVLEGTRVLAVDGTTVDDSDLVGLGANLVLEVGSDLVVDLLGVLGGGSETGTDGPDGLVGNDHVGPVLDLGDDGVELGSDNVQGLASLLLVNGLSDTEDDVETVVKSVLGLVGNPLGGLLVDGSSLGVAENDPLGSNVLELGHRHLTGEGTVSLVERVLASHRHGGLLQRLLGEQEVGEGGRDDHLGLGVELGGVESLNNGLDGLQRAVHLEVSANKKGSRLC